MEHAKRFITSARFGRGGNARAQGQAFAARPGGRTQRCRGQQARRRCGAMLSDSGRVPFLRPFSPAAAWDRAGFEQRLVLASYFYTGKVAGNPLSASWRLAG